MNMVLNHLQLSNMYDSIMNVFEKCMASHKKGEISCDILQKGLNQATLSLLYLVTNIWNNSYFFDVIFLIFLYSGLFQKNDNKFQITKDLIETIRGASDKTNRFPINSIINIVLGLIQLVSVILKKKWYLIVKWYFPWLLPQLYLGLEALNLVI